VPALQVLVAEWESYSKPTPTIARDFEASYLSRLRAPLQSIQTPACFGNKNRIGATSSPAAVVSLALGMRERPARGSRRMDFDRRRRPNPKTYLPMFQ